VGRKRAADQGVIRREERVDGIDVIRTYVYAHPRRSALRRLASYLSFAASALLATRRVGSSDVLVFSSGPLFVALPAMWASFRYGIPLVMDLRDLWPERVAVAGKISRLNPVYLFLAAVERAAYRRSGLIVTVTEGLCRRLVERGVEPAKLEVIYNGVDVLETDGSLQSGGELQSAWKTEGLRVVESGTIGLVQSPETAVRAVHRLEEADPMWGEWLFCGEGPKLGPSRAMATALGVENLRFVGHVEPTTMFAHLSSANVGVVTLSDNPHNDMAVPRRLFDYFGARLPIVYSGRGEGADIVRRNGTGLVCPPEDPDALVEALLWIKDHPGEAGSMGERGRRLLEDRFDMRRSAERYLEAMLAILS